MDLPTQPVSATSEGKETLLQNQRAYVFNIPSTAQGTEATRLLGGNNYQWSCHQQRHQAVQ